MDGGDTAETMGATARYSISKRLNSLASILVELIKR